MFLLKPVRLIFSMDRARRYKSRSAWPPGSLCDYNVTSVEVNRRPRFRHIWESFNFHCGDDGCRFCWTSAVKILDEGGLGGED